MGFARILGVLFMLLGAAALYFKTTFTAAVIGAKYAPNALWIGIGIIVFGIILFLAGGSGAKSSESEDDDSEEGEEETEEEEADEEEPEEAE